MGTPAVKRARSPAVELYAESELPTVHGTFRVRVYYRGEEEIVAVTLGSLGAERPVFTRVHSECFTGEVLGSLKCDCREQLERALAEIAERQEGVLIYLRQEGRGIGLGNKIRAYALQSQGADTIEANHQLGFPTDLREFGGAALVLRDLGIRQIELNTNNPEKLRDLEGEGIEVSQRAPAHGSLTPHNHRYLETKKLALGHDLAAVLMSSGK